MTQRDARGLVGPDVSGVRTAMRQCRGHPANTLSKRSSVIARCSHNARYAAHIVIADLLWRSGYAARRRVPHDPAAIAPAKRRARPWPLHSFLTETAPM